MQLTVSAHYKGIVLYTLDQHKRNYLYVEHSLHKDHVHFFLEDVKGCSFKSAKQTVINQINRVCKKQHTGIPSIGKGKDIVFHQVKDTIVEWLTYMAHEGNTYLGGNMANKWQDRWEAISAEQAHSAKEQQIQGKVEWTAMQACKTKMTYMMWITLLLQKYNNQELTTIRMSKEDRKQYGAIPGNHQIMMDIRDNINLERVNFERQCRGNKPDRLRWYDIALCELFKVEMTQEEKNWVLQSNLEYLAAGMKLIQTIFTENQISFLQFWEDVTAIMECRYNKLNTLFLVGQSNAGKTTISKIITQWTHRALINQSGNASQFIFQDAPNKTAIVMEEAIFPPGTVDDYKNICEGSTNIAVNVKNKRNTRIDTRTPLITTSNKAPWASYCSNHEETFRNRGYYYEFHKAINHEQIEAICEEYPRVLASPGEIHVSMVHMLALYEKLTKPDFDYKQFLAEMKALAQHDWTCEDQDWIEIDKLRFDKIRANAKIQEPHESDDDDMELDTPQVNGQLVEPTVQQLHRSRESSIERRTDERSRSSSPEVSLRT